MRTDAELDALHESLVAKYPGGLTIAQFKQCVLESADDDGRVYPPSVHGFSVIPHSILTSMVLRDKNADPCSYRAVRASGGGLRKVKKGRKVAIEVTPK